MNSNNQMSLYPLKFKPILKERLWGGNRLATHLGKDLEGKQHIGESWEISAVEDDISVVINGFLAGNDLQELIGIYMGELVGDKVFSQFGDEFPLLIKFIDANDDLSIQVHPDDAVAAERHHSYGKTEMWYALDGSPDTKLILGFNRDTSRGEFLEKLNNGSLTDLFHYETVAAGDAFFVPARRLHAICSGNLVAEIQQTSDVTYRIYDYNRTDEKGNARDLHLDLSLDVMDYQKVADPKVKYMPNANQPVQLVSCSYFTTNVLNINTYSVRDYYRFDSFVILIAVEGSFSVSGEGFDPVNISKGETVLLPAALSEIRIDPIGGHARLLEVYLD